jgi:integrase
LLSPVLSLLSRVAVPDKPAGFVAFAKGANDMPRGNITETAISSLKKPAKGRRYLYDRGDGAVTGFCVCAYADGRKTYMLGARFPALKARRRKAGRTAEPAFSRRFIGKVGDMTLATARQKAREWRQLIAAGKDPAEHEASQRRAAALRRAETFEDVAKKYLERYVRGPERKRGPMRTAADTEYAINRWLAPRWGTLPVTAITADHIKELCEDFERRGIVAHARNVFSITRSLFKWAVGKRYYALTDNPCDGLEPGKLIGEVQARKRVLDDAEIRAFWKACETLGYPYRDLLRLVLLTGCRREEAADASWREIDTDAKTFTIPPERFKSDRTHIVPLSDRALAIIGQLPRFKDGDRVSDGYVFTTTNGQKPVDGFSKAKIKLDGAMQAILGETKLPPFTIHDLRRTVRTRLSELRIQPVVAEAVIGHSLPGLLGVYDQFGYLDEKRDALQRWADHLGGILKPKPAEAPREDGGNVIAMPVRAAQ